MTGGFDVADHAALMTGLHVFLDPDHNGQLLPAGRKLQPLRNVAVIISPSKSKKKGTFQLSSVHKIIATGCPLKEMGLFFLLSTWEDNGLIRWAADEFMGGCSVKLDEVRSTRLSNFLLSDPPAANSLWLKCICRSVSV